MARKKEAPCPPLAIWLVTFSDLVTLLLTFFVLLLTMSSMDNSYMTRVTLGDGDLGYMDAKGGGKISIALYEIVRYLENPWDLLEKKNRVKDLLYPDDTMPKDISKSSLQENLKILIKNDGVALVFTKDLLFGHNESKLTASGKALLGQIYPLLDYMQEPVLISGHASADEANVYDLSGDRALDVLKYFLEKGIPDAHFTISCAGADKPLLQFTQDKAAPHNRRVEILIRTTQALSSYL